MDREVISDKQGIMLLILFITGSTLVLPTAVEAGRDLWLAILLAVTAAGVAVFIYARILYLFPTKDLFDITQELFGRFLGKLLVLIYTWFAFHLCVLVLRNFGDFISIVGLEGTPMIVPMAVTGTLCIWGVKEGIEVLGRWAEFFLPITALLMLTAILLLIPNMKIDYLLPILYNGIKPVLKGGYAVFTFPFAETVLFLAAFDVLKRKESAYKVYFTGLALGGFAILISSLTEVAVLGIQTYKAVYFPAYIAVARLNIGEFIQRMEIIVAIVFLIGGFIKVSICLLAACKGITKLFGIADYRFVVTPVGALVINTAFFIYGSVMETVEWASQVWPYYAFPFQVALPILIWIAAELKSRKREKQEKVK